jgi:hypothetical protein
LLFDMVRRIRRQKIRAEVEAMLDAEEAAARGSKPGSRSKKK